MLGSARLEQGVRVKASTLAFLAGTAIAGTLVLRASPGQDQTPTFRAAVRLIDVDVVVTDRQGNPVRGLTQEDFEIVEDDRPQQIRTFFTVDLPFETPATLADWRARDVEPDVTTNTLPESRTYVLLLDAVGLRARHIAERWLDEVVHPNDRVAVVHVQGTFSDSQTFTSSRRLILDSIDRMIWGAGGSVDTRPVETRQLDTLRAIQDVAERLGTIAGRRKAIVWLTQNPPNFYPTFDHVQGRASPPDSGAIVLAAWRDASRVAIDNNVAIYPVDPQGLTTELGLASLVRMASIREVAEETGGVAVGVNTNNFSRGFATIVQDASAYYLLGYSPEPERTDGKFHTIRVRVKREDVTVRARRGYYAHAPGATPPAGPPASLPRTVSASAAAALRRPVPVRGVGVDVFTVPFRDSGRDSRDSSVLIGAHVRAAALEAPDSAVTISYQIFDVEGRIATGGYRTFGLTPAPRGRAGAGSRGFRFLERVTLKPGRYELRLVAEPATRPDGPIGSVLAHIEAPDYRRTPLMSGIALALRDAAREVALAGDATLREVLGAEPTALRTFRASDRLSAFVEVYARRPADEVTVAGTLAPTVGDIARRLETRPVASRRDADGNRRGFQSDVDLAGLAPGQYVITLEARSPAQREAIASRQLPFTIE
jgi:VWFA-related protein